MIIDINPAHMPSTAALFIDQYFKTWREWFWHDVTICYGLIGFFDVVYDDNTNKGATMLEE